MPSFRDVVFTISSISDVSEILPAIAWISVGKKRLPYALLGIFVIISFLIKTYTLVTAELHVNNMPAYHLLALVEMLAVYAFCCMLISGRIYKRGIVLLIVFNLGNTLFIQDVSEFNSVAWTVDMLLIIMIGFTYIFKLYQDDEDYTPLDKRPDFMITIAWLLYASGSFFPYLMSSEILTGYADGFFKHGWVFQTASTIMRNIILSYGFWLTRKI